MNDWYIIEINGMIILGAFARLREVTASSLRPSVRTSALIEQLSYYMADFYKIWHLSTFRKCFEKIPDPLKSNKNTEYCTWRRIYISDNISMDSSCIEKYSSNTCREKKKIIFTVTLLLKNLPFVRLCGRMWYSQRGHRRLYNTAHAHWLLDN